MEIAASLGVSLATAAAFEPLHGFLLLCWNQPTSFVAQFAVRRIDSVTDLFLRRVAGADTHNTQDFYWLRRSTRAWVPSAVFRGLLMWVSCGGPALVVYFIRRQRAKYLHEQAQQANGEAETAKTTTATTTSKIIQYIHAPALTTLVSAVTLPMRLVLTIFTADISGGYPTLYRAWRGVVASAINDYERDNPIYVVGRNPWNKTRKLPPLVKLLYEKMSATETWAKVALPWIGAAVANSCVSTICQQVLPKVSSSSLSLQQGAPSKVRRYLQRFLSAAKVFGIAAVAHGLVAYFVTAKPLAGAVRTAIKTTDYSQPYSMAGGRASVANPGVLEVPRATLLHAVVEGISWSLVTTTMVLCLKVN